MVTATTVIQQNDYLCRTASMKSYVFTSGKGGVGKTSLAVNTAIAMARLNRRVVIFDADLGLANVDVLMGINPHYTLRHVLRGKKNLRDIIVPGPGGISVIPGGTGIRELADLSQPERERFIENFADLQNEFDILIVDTSAGITPNVLSFIFAGDLIVLVTTPEPTALTDTYALIKVVSIESENPGIGLLVNMAPDSATAMSTARKIQSVAATFLNLGIDYLGFIPEDSEVGTSVHAQVPVIIKAPDSPSAKAISMLARRLCNGQLEKVSSASMMWSATAK